MSYRDWQVGDKVVCVDVLAAPTLEKGRVYTVEWLEYIGDSAIDAIGRPTGAVGVRLVEAIPLPEYTSFAIHRFRKVQPRKTDIAIFTAMLNPEHHREYELGDVEVPFE